MSTEHSERGQGPWLIMVYLAGDNDLSEEMVLTLQDLMTQAPPAGGRIVAQFDPGGVGLTSQRYAFVERPEGLSLAEKLEAYRDQTFQPSDTNTGDKQSLIDFVTWAVDTHGQAGTRYLLVLSGHGSGITDDFFLSDSASTDSLTIQELREALDTIVEHIRGRSLDEQKKIDILGLDACFMAMGEVAYELKDDVGILIAAEGTEPALGWPYRRILARARAFDHATHARDVATTIVEEYVEHYSDYDRSAGGSADLAAIDLGRIEPVTAAFKSLTEALVDHTAENGHDAVLLAHWYAQTYKFDQFVDLADLCYRLQEKCGGSAVPDACGAVIAALEEAVLVAGCTGFAAQHSHGFSIYFPWAAVSPDYGPERPSFAAATGWHTFVTGHIVSTRREPRYLPEMPQLRPLADAVTARAERIRRKFQGPVGEPLVLTLERQCERVERADVLEMDRPRELGRRVRRLREIDSGGDVRYSDHTRYSDQTRYSDHTRFLSGRQWWVKNLPPAVGKAYWPGKEARSPQPGDSPGYVEVARS